MHVCLNYFIFLAKEDIVLNLLFFLFRPDLYQYTNIPIHDCHDNDNANRAKST